MVNQNKPRLRRNEVTKYMEEKHGIPLALKTLNKMASVGGGPAMRYVGRIPLYDVVDLDRWAMEQLSEPVTSTSGRAA